MKLEGLSIDFLGDSLTEGRSLENRDIYRYDNVLREECHLAWTKNYGVAGTRICYQRHPSQKARHDLDFCGRAYDLDPSADIICVFGGINDYASGDADFGSIADTGRETFCGSVNYLCRLICELYPSSLHVFLTPLKCVGWDKITDKPIPEGVDKRPLKQYVDAIETIAARHGFEVLNLFEKLKVDPNREEDRVMYTIDGVHLNARGHRMLADLLRDFLLQHS